MALKRREEIKARGGVDLGRLARKGSGALTYTAIVLVIVALALAISLNVHHGWDTSRSGSNRLSEQTIAVLENLEHDIEIYPLFTRNHRLRESYWYILQKYREVSPRISVEFVDPVAQPGKVESLGIDTEERDLRRSGVTVVVQGETRRVFEGMEEEEITNAILDAGRTERRLVGFLRGYGERDPKSESGSGFLRASAALAQEYYELTDVRLSDGIPAEVTVLVAAGLRMPVPEEDRARLSQWLEEGGRLLVLTDPGAESGLNDVLERWGLRAEPEQILEPTRRVNQDPQFLRVTHYSDHEIVEGFGSNLPTGFPVAGPVTHFEPGDPLVFHDALALTGPTAVAIGSDGRRTEGTLTVAAASWRRESEGEGEKETRIVLVGDTDFASTQYLPYRANRNFFLNCMGWLSRESQLVSVRRQPLEDQFIVLRSGEFKWLMLSAWGAPALVLVAGVIVYFRRRGL